MNASKYIGVGMVCLLGGCIGPVEIGVAPPSTARHRYEFEMISNAELARENTTPRTHGRYGYKSGADQLLVVTRITSVAENSDEPDGARVDKYFERVWLTVPLGAPQGSEIYVNDMESLFLEGYDRNDRGEGYFIRPNRTTGKIVLMQKKSESSVVLIDIQVAPQDGDTWRVNETREVPLTETGHHATMVRPVQIYRVESLIYPEVSSEMTIPSDLESDPGKG